MPNFIKMKNMMKGKSRQTVTFACLITVYGKYWNKKLSGKTKRYRPTKKIPFCK